MLTPRQFTFTEIGRFHSTQIEAYQASRQPDILSQTGFIQLFSKQNYEQALQDLKGCSHLWIIFGFHKNENWKPLVQTPRSDKKIGVFATRAPYRPNPIGLSLVKLIKIEGLQIHVSENDLLDDSPIFDIKPYHPESDLATEAKIGWLEKNLHPKNKIHFSPLASEQLDWLAAKNETEIKSFILRQLEYDPFNSNKKRVTENLGYWTLAYRTWRIDFSASEQSLGVLAIRSGYTQDELHTEDDPYNDKKRHREFNKIFE